VEVAREAEQARTVIEERGGEPVADVDRVGVLAASLAIAEEDDAIAALEAGRLCHSYSAVAQEASPVLVKHGSLNGKDSP
jgi:hypothetical protein